MFIFLLAIFDVKADCYLPPFFAPALAHGMRTFSDFANDLDTPIGMHPSDYTLFHLGTFDKTTGLLESLDPKVSLGNGVEFRAAIEASA